MALPSICCALVCIATLPLACCSGADAEPIAEVTVTASLLPSWVGAGAFDGVVLDARKLHDAPQQRLDGILREVPGFRLFRRTDSVGAHPTTQGVSLRNVGPSGASRTVVLLDGVPVNDAFGGWVPWSRFTPSMLGGVSVVRDGGVSPWGTGSLGGVVSMDSRWLAGEAFAEVDAAAGNALEHSLTGTFAEDLDGGATRVFGGVHHSRFSGYSVIRESQRGPVDVDAYNESEWFEAGVRQALGDDWKLTLRVAGWSEQRGNGTPLAVSASEALDFSARLQRDAGAGEWGGEWIVYHQRRVFESTFTSIAADRRSEQLVLDQHDVPALTTGFIHRNRVPLGDGHLLSSGFDVRWLEGETDESFRDLGAGFTRGRVAGGAQWDSGLFVQDTWDVDEAWQVHGGVRMDYHRDSDGRLRERELASGALLRDELYPDREDLTLNARVGATWKASTAWQWRTSGYVGARQPTLNELYRPFRVGDVTTLANAALRPELIRGVDFGFRAEVTSASWVSASVFYNAVDDAVASVTQAVGPGSFQPWGFIPGGGFGARRENLERVRVRGVEVESEWRLGDALWLSAAWLGTDSEVVSARIKPRLEGLQLAQVPQQQASVGLRGEVDEVWRWSLGARWVSAQFDDDFNTRRLAGFVSVDVRVTRKIGAHAEVYAALENALDAEIQTRRDGAGIVSVGAPRLWALGLRWGF